MRRMEGGMNEADKALITRSSSSARENWESYKDRATFDTHATIQLQTQRLGALEGELTEIEQKIKDFEALFEALLSGA